MTRSLRIQYPCAVYHVTSRGNERKNIFRTDQDRFLFLRVLGEMLDEYQVVCHAWVLMDNHYHILLETPEANLSRAIRHLNGVYTQRFNRRNYRVGHLFQGRFKAILVQKGIHLLELCRYVVLNPVRARLVDHPRKWLWSSYRQTAGIEKREDWLEVGWVLGHFGVLSSRAARAYQKFVLEGAAIRESPWEKVQGHIYHGSKEFKKSLKGFIKEKNQEIPMTHKRPDRPLAEEVLRGVAQNYGVEAEEIVRKVHRVNEARDVAMFLLRQKAGLGLKAIADRFEVKYKAVSQRVWLVRKRMKMDKAFRGRVVDR